MTRGRKPTPTALKIERGNPGHRPLNEREPELATPVAKVPTGLKGRAKKEWERLAEELITKGVLTVGDMHAFEEYCRLVGEVDAYEQKIEDVGLEDAHRLGYANYLLKLRGHLRQQATQLGLTPSSRSTVKAVKVPQKDPAQTKKERFFGMKPA